MLSVFKFVAFLEGQLSNEAATENSASEFSALLSSLQSKNVDEAPKSGSAQQAEIDEQPADEKRDQVGSTNPEVLVAPLPNPTPPDPIPIELCQTDDPKAVSPVSVAETAIKAESPVTESRSNSMVVRDATENSNKEGTVDPYQGQKSVEEAVSIFEEKNAPATTEASASADKSKKPEVAGEIAIEEESTQQFASEHNHEGGTKGAKRIGAPLRLWGGRLPTQDHIDSNADPASNGSENLTDKSGNEGKESQAASNEQKPRIASRQAVEPSARKSNQVEERSKGRGKIGFFEDKPHKESDQSVAVPKPELNSTTPPPKIMDGGIEPAAEKETRPSPIYVEIPKASADDAPLQHHAEALQRAVEVDRPENSTVVGANHLLTRVEHHEMRFGWESPEFGRLEVRTTVERDRVGASVVSSDARVREFLRDDAASLSNALATHSLRLENFQTMDSPKHSNHDRGNQESQSPERRPIHVLEKTPLSRRLWESRHAGALDLHA